MQITLIETTIAKAFPQYAKTEDLYWDDVKVGLDIIRKSIPDGSSDVDSVIVVYAFILAVQMVFGQSASEEIGEMSADIVAWIMDQEKAGIKTDDEVWDEWRRENNL